MPAENRLAKHGRNRGRMNDNVVKFQRPKPQKEPPKLSPKGRKALIWLAVIAAIVLVWAYYQFVSPPSI
jgi:hypothetical protein